MSHPEPMRGEEEVCWRFWESKLVFICGGKPDTLESLCKVYRTESGEEFPEP